VVTLAQIGPAIDARPTFATMREALVDLLSDLRGAEWVTPTVCPGWAVRDVAMHLLHDDLRRLSRTRDHYHDGPSPENGHLLVAGVARPGA
jgi:hypothetical protein